MAYSDRREFDTRPTFDSIIHQIDKEDFLSHWQKDRSERLLGGMAAATLEYSTGPLEDPEGHFSDVAHAVEAHSDHYTVFLKEPIGSMGYHALVAFIDQTEQYRGYALSRLRTGFVARRFDEDAEKLLRSGGWPQWYTGQTQHPRYILGRHFGSRAIMPSRHAVVLGGHNEEIVYDQIPTLSADATLQRRFKEGVEENLRAHWTGDEVAELTEGLAQITYTDGAGVREADVLTAYDFARAAKAINREDGFTGELRARGPFLTLAQWIALSDTGDKAFAASLDDLIPDSTSLGLNRAAPRPSTMPEIALTVSTLRLLRDDLKKGSLKIEGLGSKTLRIIDQALHAHDARRLKSVYIEERRDEPRLTVEQLHFYDSDDARELGLLYKDLSKRFDGTPITKEKIEEVIYNPNRAQIVARVNEKIVGAATVNKVVGLAAGAMGYLDDFVTSSEVRGKGVGSKIWDEVIQWCKDNGCEYLEFTSGNARQAAHAFYKDRGALVRDTTVFRVPLSEIDPR